MVRVDGRGGVVRRRLIRRGDGVGRRRVLVGACSGGLSLDGPPRGGRGVGVLGGDQHAVPRSSSKAGADLFAQCMVWGRGGGMGLAG